MMQAAWQKLFGLALLSFLIVIVGLPHLPGAALTDARRIGVELAQASVSAVDLQAQGRQFYEAGQFAAAVESWQQAAEAYRQQSNPLQQALTLSYLSSAQQNLGSWDSAAQTIQQSQALLDSEMIGETAERVTAIRARVLNSQGNLQLAMGQPQAALETWQQATALYAEVADQAGVWGSQINQAQALQTLGFYRRAERVLTEVNQLLQAQPDSALKITALHSLGTVQQAVGNLEQAQQILEQSLSIAQRLNLPLETSAIQFSLANTLRAQQNFAAAMAVYQQVVQSPSQSPSQIVRIEAQLNRLNLLIAQNQPTQALLAPLFAEIEQLSPGRRAIYARVRLAEIWLKLQVSDALDVSDPTLPQIADSVATAVQQAQALHDPRAESFSVGQLGKIYAQTQQWQEAKELTQQALLLAQTVNADDIAYRWQWQLGRILKAGGSDHLAAISAYSESVKTLKALRRDLLAMSQEVQFSFRDSVEPIYRELVELLLADAAATQQPDRLKQARSVIEDLQLAELENFFRSACLDAEPLQIDTVDPSSAVIYPIILSDRLAVILSLPDQSLRYYETVLPQAEVEAVLEQVLQSLNPIYSDRERLRLSQQVYGWLVQPAEADLVHLDIRTLVFVLDGTLRNIPMAALYDGQKYLVEKYSVALTPGLQLLGPKPLQLPETKILLGGITEARQGFAALPGVQHELSRIAAKITSAKLLNQQFTAANLQAQIRSNLFSIVHLATHGQFSSTPQGTFILTWDNRITIQKFQDLFSERFQDQSQPIELLVLSACQTAEGDKRSALGVAGVAVRSGARSTLATLWAVNDQSTAALMISFYQKLAQSGMTKAEALRQAQVDLLQQTPYQHPLYWAPFVLVGNWL